MTRSLLSVPAFAIVLAMSGTPAAAQSTGAHAQAPVEITPYVSLGSYPSSRVGAAITFRVAPNLSVESEVGYRQDPTSQLSVSAGLLYDLPGWGRFKPYLAGGAGLEEYTTAFRRGDGTLAAQKQTAFVINAGGGVRVPVDDAWGIRTDARWFNGLGRDAGEHWRLYNGVTLFTGRR
jgi:opacity protein-like surface antigen